eukprot:Partr_v1_DN23364_c0_g1_i3_m18439
MPIANNSNRHHRRQEEQEEDATVLKLGAEFQNEHCLLHSEVKILLDKLRQNTEAGLSSERHNIGPLFLKTLVHVEQISRFNNPETIKEARKVLMECDLEPFVCL